MISVLPSKFDQISRSYIKSELKIKGEDPNIFQIYFQNTGSMVQGMGSFEGLEFQVFSLFKSLLSIGKPAQLSTKLDVMSKLVFFEFPQEENEKIEAYLKKLVDLIHKEIVFKRILKQIIANKNRFKSEQIFLQKALFEDYEA